MCFGRKEPCSPLRVIREQEQALTGFVQAPYWRKVREITGQQVINSLAALFIRGCCHYTSRFVQHEISSGLGLNPLAIYLYPILFQIHRRLRIAANGSVDLDPPSTDQLQRLGA